MLHRPLTSSLLIVTALILCFGIFACSSDDDHDHGSSAPTITDISPTSAKVGSTVTITGKNFSTTTTDNIVKFNGVAATVVSSTSTQIVVTIPDGATSGTLTVTVGGKTVSSSTNFIVTASTPVMGGSIQGTALALATNTYTVTTFAGSATPGTADGIGTAAQFLDPIDMTTDGTYLYVADNQNNNIRRVRISDGLVETIAGSTTGLAGNIDATGTAARFEGPVAITTDGSNLYICDYNNRSIRKMALATGEVTTFLASTATIFSGLLAGITTDGNYLYVSVRSGTDSAVYRISLADASSRVMVWHSGAQYPYIVGLTTDGSYLYGTTYGPNKLVKIDLATAFPATATDLATGLNSPNGVTTDGTYLYVSDTGSMLPEGYVTVFTLAGTKIKDMTATDGFGNLRGLTTDGVSLFVGETDLTHHNIRKIQ